MAAKSQLNLTTVSDSDLAARIAARDPGAVRLVTQRNNQRLFRAAWSILKDRSEAEDVVQTAYLRAFAAIDTFDGRAALSTWLTRIAINEALGRRRAAERRRARLDEASVIDLDEYREKLMRGSMEPAPDGLLARTEIRRLMEEAIGRLPEMFRVTFVLREIEGLSVEETAAALDIPSATVKTRHLRARRRLQQELAPELRDVLSGAFPFAGLDCEAMTERIVVRFCS